MGQILQFARPCTVDEAWDAYLELVNERMANNLWADREHNQRIVRAWDVWSKMYLEWCKE